MQSISDPREESVNEEEEVYQNAISYEEELLESPNEMFFQQNESFDLGFATNVETQGGEYVRSFDEEQNEDEHEHHQPYYEEYGLDEGWSDDFREWQRQDDCW